MKKGYITTFAIVLAVAGEAAAATYTQDFDGFANGTTNLGDGSVMAGSAQIQNDALQLTVSGAFASTSSFSIPALVDSSLGWTATFDVTITHVAGGIPPGEGMSFNYGNAPLGALGSGEEGMSNFPGVTDNVSFEIDSFDVDEGVGIAEIVTGADTDIAFTGGPILNAGTTVTAQATLTYSPAGEVSFTTTGLLTDAAFNNVVTAFTGDDAYNFIISARTATGTQTVLIDNLVINTPPPALPEVEIAVDDSNAAEGPTDTATFQITRTTSTGDLTVDLAQVINPDSASTSDFVLNPPLGSIIIPDGSNSLTVTMTAVDDVAAETDELLDLEVQADPGYTIGPNSQAGAIIVANDFVVTNTNDFDPLVGTATAAQREGTLRQAVINANDFGNNANVSFNAVPFSDNVPDTITLSGREIRIDRAMTIQGPGADLLTLTALNLSRIFRVSDDIGSYSAAISGLNLTFGAALGANAAGRGGAIYAAADIGGGSGLDLTLTECSFASNAAVEGAAVAFESTDGHLTVNRCVFEANLATTEAGALAFYNGLEARINDSTFALNGSNGRAGAVLVTAGSTTLTNATIAGNRTDDNDGGEATDIGGGLFVGPGVPCLINNTLIAGNLRGLTTPVADDIGGLVDAASMNNLISDPASSGGLADGAAGNIVGQSGGVFPLFDIVQTELGDQTVPLLANNGGPTRSVRLQRGSPAIEAGNNSLTSGSGFDQRGLGFPRIVQGFPDFGIGIGSTDIGATEFNPLLVTTDADEDDGTADPTVGAGTSLREAIAVCNAFPGTDLIIFSQGLNGTTNFFDAGNPKTITVDSQLIVSSSVEISGPGADLLTLSGDSDLSGSPTNADTRIFTFNGLLPDGSFPRSILERVTVANGNPTISGTPQDGGGIFNEANLAVFDTVFQNNTGLQGGAIHTAGVLNLIRTTLEGNQGTQAGGGLFATQLGFVSVQRATFLMNNANQGGAVYADSGTIILVNSTLSQNTAFEGGGLYYQGGNVSVSNCTIAENSSSSASGGGIHFSGVGAIPNLELDNTILAANLGDLPGPFPSDIFGGNVAVGSTNNLVSDAATAGGLTDATNGNIVGNGGTGTIDLNTILEPLADNGGFTLTYLPTASSLAINNGDNNGFITFGPLPSATDQREQPRIFNVDIDIGSVESQAAEPVLDPIGDQFGDEFDSITFTAAATIPGGVANPIFSLDGGALGSVPAGATIDPNTGDFEWTPSEADGPGTFTFDVVVERDDDPGSTDRETITIDIFEVNDPPAINPIANQDAAALVPFTLTAAAFDFDDPANLLTFTLDAASEALGMTIDPDTGDFAWTPTIAQAPGVYPVTVSVDDDGAPSLGDSASFTIRVADFIPPVVSLNGGGFSVAHEPGSFSGAPPAANLGATFFLQRNNTVGDVIVTLRIDDDSQAIYNSDFQVELFAGGAVNFTGNPLLANVTIPDGNLFVQLTTSAINDFAAEPDEPINLSIIPQPEYTIGTGGLSQVISQNDFGVDTLGDFDPLVDPDLGEGTIRQAVINAKANLALPGASGFQPADITFATGLTGDISLTAGPLLLDTFDFSITGPGSDVLAISGDDISRAFIAYAPNGARSYTISGLGIMGGLTGGNGGGIFNSETLVLEDCTISGCIANYGGAISNEGDLTMTRCLLASNEAIVYGGGLDNYDGTATLRDCTIIDNLADFGGGIENSAAGILNVEACTVSGNASALSGGGVDSYSADTSISNTTISGNTAGYGAGVFNEQSMVTILQSTIAENSAATSSGGILGSSNAPAGTTILHNTIVAGNTVGDGTPADIATANSSFVDVDPASSFNLIGDADSSAGLLDATNGNLVGIDGTGIRPLDSIIAALADNGGPTATHQLVPASAAIDAGDDASALDTNGDALDNDQRGASYLRIVDGSVDIGAFEVNPVVMEIVSCELSAGPEAKITWRSTAGRQYDVLCSTDLKNWQVIATGVPATSALTSYTDPTPPADQAYFVVRETKL